MKKNFITTLGLVLGIQSNAMPGKHLLQNEQVFLQMEKEGSLFVLKTVQAQANIVVKILMDNGFTNFTENIVSLDHTFKGEKSVQIDSALKSIFGSNSVDIIELDDKILSVICCV